MRNKRKILAVCGILLLLAVNLLIVFHKGNVTVEYDLQIELSADQTQEIQIYYSEEKGWSESSSQTRVYENVGEEQVLEYSIPSNSKYIRLDLGKKSGSFEITQMTLAYKGISTSFPEIEDMDSLEMHQIEDIQVSEDCIYIGTEGEDGHITLVLPTEEVFPLAEKDCRTRTVIMNVLALLFLDGGALIAFLFRKKIGILPVELYQNRGMILNLAKNDFKTKYAGSYLGIIWAFIQPIVTILVYWFVFTVGFRAGTASDYPFVLYLVTGMVPWFFFQDALNGGTNALIEYSYLVKKVVFKISILPIVKILSALFVHVFFVAIALVLACLYGYLPGPEVVQVFYYSICNFMLVLGLVYATSAIVIFFRDLSQIISIFLQIGVWMTPIMWDLNMLANNPMLMKLFRLNPMFYIVSGYRDAILGRVWFWEHFGWTLYFWVFTAVLFVLGTVIFKRLKPHFADVL